ncbi:putative RNA-binding protein Luc7-like 2 [Ciona intestinalis]
MSAQSQMRAMLDQLMGTQRDGTGSKSLKFDEDSVCKTFLLGCCPNDILSGTRADIGDCRKVHDLALKADYEMASISKDYFYDFDAFDHLKSFISDTDQKIEVSKKRLAEQQAEVSAEVQGKATTVQDLNEQIRKLLVKAEELGMQGEIEESKTVLSEVEKVKILKQEAEEAYKNSMPASTYQQQKLRVCEVCSAYLGLHDNDCRLADHFGGKLHAGFIQIRLKLDELKKKVTERKSEYEAVLLTRRMQQKERNGEERRRREKRYSPSHRRRHDGYRSSNSNRKSRERSRSRSRDRSYKRRSSPPRSRRSRS